MSYRTLLATWLGTLALISAPAGYAAEVVKVGATPGATADAIAALAKEVKANGQGLDIQLIEFTDWTLPNEAVDNGDIDLNFFQHQAFLDNAVKERGYHIELIGLGLLQNIGLYSDSIERLEDIPNNAQIAVANDPVNQGRGLLLLQKAGLIKLRDGNAVGASIHDVVDNPKQLKFIEIEGPQLIRSLQDVDLAVVWPSYFVNAGRKDKASQALIYSGIDDTFYAMGFAARSDKANEPKLRQFVELFQSSPAVRQVISEQFDGNPNLYTLPWQR